MGIQNLLRELAPLIRKCHLSEFSGNTAGIDAYAWLHRASFSCAYQLVFGKPTTKYVDFCIDFANLLKHFGITPLFVFDGDQLPMKANEEQKRRESRKKHEDLAKQYYQNGDKEKGYQMATRAIRITRQMVKSLIKKLKSEHIDFVVAPYEADSQLAYMYRKKEIDLVITEDSDLVLFGVERVIYKLKKKTGCGEFLDITTTMNFQIANNSSKQAKLKCLPYFMRKYPDLIDLIHICVLSGCDYVNGVKGFGLKTACKYVSQVRNINMLLQQIKREGRVNDDYKYKFDRAVFAFCHSRVYDRSTKCMTHLTPIDDAKLALYFEELNRYLRRMQSQNNNKNSANSNTKNDAWHNPSLEDTSLDFLGPPIDDNTARLIAEGKMDPRTKRNISSFGNNGAGGATQRSQSFNGGGTTQHSGNNNNNKSNTFYGKTTAKYRNNNSKTTVDTNPFNIGSFKDAVNETNQKNQNRNKRKNAMNKSVNNGRNGGTDKINPNAKFGSNNKVNDVFDLDSMLSEFGYDFKANVPNMPNFPNIPNANTETKSLDDSQDTLEMALENDFKDPELRNHGDDMLEFDSGDDHKPLQRTKTSRIKRKRKFDEDCDGDSQNCQPNIINIQAKPSKRKKVNYIQRSSVKKKNKAKLPFGQTKASNEKSVDSLEEDLNRSIAFDLFTPSGGGNTSGKVNKSKSRISNRNRQNGNVRVQDSICGGGGGAGDDDEDEDEDDDLVGVNGARKGGYNKLSQTSAENQMKDFVNNRGQYEKKDEDDGDSDEDDDVVVKKRKVRQFKPPAIVNEKKFSQNKLSQKKKKKRPIMKKTKLVKQAPKQTLLSFWNKK